MEDKLNQSLDDIIRNSQPTRGRGRGRGARGGGGRGRGGGPMFHRTAARSSPYQRQSSGVNMKSLTNRLYVHNLSYSTSWQNLKDHFRACGNVVFTDVFVDDTGRSKGCGIVEYETRQEAIKAVNQLDGSDLDGRIIHIREDREDHFGGKKGPSVNNQIFVRNLPYSTSWQDLKDVFSEYGNVVRADILQTLDGRSKGCGIVIYEVPAAAARAIQAANGLELDGRPIEVRMDTFA